MGKKILIVEDEFIVANEVRSKLKKAGYTVIGIAVSANEAEEIIQKNRPDLVILDIRLIGSRSGIDLASKLRDENLAFIYLSASSSQKVLEAAKTTEPYGFLVKPFRDKELLITLDIALYRHHHSLESRLRQEDLLQKQLVAISDEAAPAQQKLAKIASALQSIISFDFIVLGIRPVNDTHYSDFGYLRTGYDEYQFIGELELAVISGLNKQVISNLKKDIFAGNEVHIFNKGKSSETIPDDSIQKIIFSHFAIESYLFFPASLSDGSSVHYSFYSRQRGIYNQNHIELLGRLKMCLIATTDKIFCADPVSLSKIHPPVSGNIAYKGQLNRPGFEGIIGNHPLLLAALDLTAQVAPYNTSVLILGESGTGKEKIAFAIHGLSLRKAAPFIKVNCAAIPAALIESELFGHEKGAFTGAVDKRKGRFEQADGGTIFLDEIGELPLDMQVKLLRVLQEKEIDYVGGVASKKVDVRIVAATNRNLEEEVAAGNFRLDLYYRLNIFPIKLPALRDRKSDLPALASFFANRFCTDYNKEFTGFSDDMMDEMFAYSWPGNIRELENVLERSVILNNGRSKLDLQQNLNAIENILTPVNNINTLEDVKQIQRETEKRYIISILKKANGRIRGANGAAEILNIKATTLEAKIVKLGITKDDY